MKVRFNIRYLMYLVTTVAVVAAYVGVVARRGQVQMQKVQAVTNANGMVLYDYVGDMYRPSDAASDSWVTLKLRNAFGDVYFGSVKHVGFLGPLPGEKTSLPDLAAVQTLPNVTDISFVDYSIDANFVKELAAIENLRSLALYRCTLSEDAIATLPLLDHLESLALSESSLSGQAFNQICTSMAISDLRVFSSTFNGTDLSNLSSLKTLKTLAMSGLPISDENLRWIADNLSIEGLRLMHTESYTTSGLLQLTKMKSLNTLRIVDCPQIQEQEILDSFTGCNVTIDNSFAETFGVE